jgi:hypothetical protein
VRDNEMRLTTKWTSWSAHLAWGGFLTVALSVFVVPFDAAAAVGVFWILWEVVGGIVYKPWRRAVLDLLAGWLGVMLGVAVVLLQAETFK